MHRFKYKGERERERYRGTIVKYLQILNTLYCSVEMFYFPQQVFYYTENEIKNEMRLKQNEIKLLHMLVTLCSDRHFY